MSTHWDSHVSEEEDPAVDTATQYDGPMGLSCLQTCRDLRSRCMWISQFPLQRMNIQDDLSSLFPNGSPCHRLAVCIQNYEKSLASSTVPESIRIRHLLGDIDPMTSRYPVTGSLAARDSLKVSALLSIYRLLDMELSLKSQGHQISLPPPFPNQITSKMVSLPKIKPRWKQLSNWQDLLFDFRDSYQNFVLGDEDMVTVTGSPYKQSLVHLQGLADSHLDQKIASVVQNFRGAALHWSLLHEMINLDNRLPTIPETLANIVGKEDLRNMMTFYEDHTLQKMENYLKEHRNGELVLPLHLSLLLTPCFLLMPTPLVKSNFPGQALSQSLGNQKPEVLIQVEKEIWTALSKISQDSSLPNVHKAFQELLASNSVMVVFNMPSTDPAFSFFQAMDHKNQHNSIPTLKLINYTPTDPEGATNEVVGPQDKEDIDCIGNHRSEEAYSNSGDSQEMMVGNINKGNAFGNLVMPDIGGRHVDGASGGMHVDVTGSGMDIVDGSTGSGMNMSDNEAALDVTEGGMPNDMDTDSDSDVTEGRISGMDTTGARDIRDNDNNSEDGESEMSASDDNATSDDLDELQDDGGLRHNSLQMVPTCKRPFVDYREKPEGSKRLKIRKRAAQSGRSEVDVHRLTHWDKLTDEIFIDTQKCNLDMMSKISPKVKLQRTIQAWGPQGETLEFVPFCHDQKALDALTNLFARIEECYKSDGRPLYLENNEETPQTAESNMESVFKIVSQEAFCKMGHSEVQQIMRRQHIVVTGIEHERQSFEDALLDIAPLDWITSIQDLSIPNGSEQTRTGKLEDILKASQSEDSKILNALNLKDPLAGIALTSFSSHAHAMATVFHQEGSSKQTMSTEHLHWKLAATKDAHHVWHIDSDGYATFVNVLTGSKWWIVARPKGTLDCDFLNTTSLLLHDDFHLDSPCPDLFDIEAILLQPGTQLIMRPNTLHTVYSPEHTVCRGGHFYATSTMRDTVVGVIHTFICDHFISNSSYFESRPILASIINFYHTTLVKRTKINGTAMLHVPDVSQEGPFVDLLVVCSMGVLINVLCPMTYTAPGLHYLSKMDRNQANSWDRYDVNGISEFDRKRLCLVRGQSLELVLWLAKAYSVTGPIPNTSTPDLFLAIIVNICKALCDYKWRADKNKILCLRNFTLERLKTQIHAALVLIVQMLDLPPSSIPKLNVMEWELPMTDTTILPQIPPLIITRNPELDSSLYKRKSQAELCKMGETELDKKFAHRLEIKLETKQMEI